MLTIPLEQSQTSTIGPAGTASQQFGPNRAGEWWSIELVTVTGLNLTVSVARNGAVIDSTTADPRPTVTSDSEYPINPGDILTVDWSGGVSGAQVTATINGKMHLP